MLMRSFANKVLDSLPCFKSLSIKKMELLEKRILKLKKELDESRFDNQHQADVILSLKNQICQKNKEIEMLCHAEKSFSGDYCLPCKQKEIRIKSLEMELTAAVDKQHEAMGRALQLAERNQHLERELKDIDTMALEIEKECQNKVKQSLCNMNILQGTLKQKVEEIKQLEGTVCNMKSKIQQNEQEMKNLRIEKQKLEQNLSLAANEKKNLNDKINNFLLIEKNLNFKISRLQDANKTLQQQNNALEERVLDILKFNGMGGLKEIRKKRNPVLGLPNCKTVSNSLLSSNSSIAFRDDTKCCAEGHCFHIHSNTGLLDNERDFHYNKFHCQEEALEHSANSDWKSTLWKELKDKEKEISDLKRELFTLKRENNPICRRCDFDEEQPIKILLDKLEKERDMALTDISRLQGERDALREKIKLVTESQRAEQSRLERILNENEERIRRLESERRELISSQSCQRAALASVEEKFDECKEKARISQAELAQISASYNQLKALQEQTDRSLSDVQSRLAQADIEMRLTTNKIKELEKGKADLESEISLLRKEKCSLKSNLAFVEKEKDGLLINLDEKTEKVAKLENQIKRQEEYSFELKENISLLEKKLEFTLNEKANRELSLRTLEQSLEQVKEELRAVERQKEALVRENRRLQDDLASAAKDCLNARKKLDDEKLEVDNLKKQLQQYFGEVKKAEELLTKKESERDQMLEHFRCLSIEATALESNNQTLESTVENAKTQLISANGRIADLESQVRSKDGLLSSYENQIAELTSRIAEMESRLKQEADSRARTEEDLNALRNLCSTIDGQRQEFKKQADDRDAEKFHLMNEVRRLSEEYEGLSQKLCHERSLSQTLEKSLSNSRQETLEHKITNKDLQAQVQHLKEKVAELTDKLESESRDVRSYQSQCADLSRQVGELRREVTNARFEQAKAVEDSRRNTQLSFFDDEDEEEKSLNYREKEERKSPRNVPPLTFREDSDRTVSLASEEDMSRLAFEFAERRWRLSPLPEKLEGTSAAPGAGAGAACPADTASDLSSLPEDSGPKAPPECPTYSVRPGSPYSAPEAAPSRRFFAARPSGDGNGSSSARNYFSEIDESTFNAYL